MVKGQHQRRIQAHFAKHSQALVERHQRRGRGFRPKDAERVRIKRDDCRNGFLPSRVLPDASQDFLMSAVNAIEIADGEDGARGGLARAETRAPFFHGMRYDERHQSAASSTRPS